MLNRYVTFYAIQYGFNLHEKNECVINMFVITF